MPLLSRMRMKGTKVLLACLLAVVLSAGPDRASADHETLETAGDIGAVALPAVAAGVTAWRKDGEGAVQLGKALLSTVAVTAALKLSVREEAPNGDDHAFPSGHTSVAFAGASYLHRRYGREVGLPAYLAASFVGASRVASDHHRVHDVLAGAAIGILSNVVFTTPRGEVSASPVIGQGFVGVALHASFR